MAKLRWLDDPCPVCGGRMNSWDQRVCKALAYKRTICEGCVAKEYGVSKEYLRDTMQDFFGMRPCQGI